jgi:hypothetical protein
MKQEQEKCKICGCNNLNKIFRAKVLNKYDVGYFQCPECLFIQTETPYWLEEAYSSAITLLDIGLLQRNSRYLPRVASMIELFFDKTKLFLDFAGGYGIFVRLMRDKGYRFLWQDEYCENIFARGFEFTPNNNSQLELITAFEVLEHLDSPMDTLKTLLNYSGNILFSTDLQPDIIINPENWHYIAPELGQHISFYHLKTLKTIAHKFDMNFYTNGRTLHLRTKKKIHPILFHITTRRKISSIISKISGYSNQSLGASDYVYLKSTLTNIDDLV